MLSDRIKILRNASWPDVSLAPQVLISCQSTSNGCHGGDSSRAFEWIKEHGIQDETCSLYQARGWTNGLQCSDFITCGNCAEGKGCWPIPEHDVYEVETWG